MDFIITSLQSWDIKIGSTIKNTAMEIAKKNRVLYVNPAIDYASYLRGARISDKRLRQVHPNLWVADVPFLIHSVGPLPPLLFNQLNHRNNRKIGKFIVKTALKLGFHNYIHLIDTDLFRSLHLKEYIHPSVSIYYRRDYVIGVPYWRKNGPRCEETLVRQSDIVLTNSSYFAGQLRAWNPDVHVINTGVNLKLYDATKHWEKPAELQTITSPIIGYTGFITESRLDSELLYTLAQRHTEYSFVFVGPEDEYFQNHPLHMLKNVLFTGHKEVQELPGYIQHFDVCINPQKVNPITEGNYPLKVDEYLAMGKPVVATSTHTMRDIFARHTHLATSTEEWGKTLRIAIAESKNTESMQARIAFAHTHSWEESVKSIYQIIENYQNKKQ